MKRKWIFYSVFFVVLVLGFFFTLTKMIPGFANPSVPPVGYVEPFRFTNQDGQPVTEKDVAGKVYVVGYFFTTCKGICPRMNNNIKRVYEHFKGEKDFLILSHTCDPETDNPAQLKRYADSMGVDTRQWIFLTGRKDSLYNMARLSYHIDDPANNLRSIDEDFLHTQFLALVNKKGAVKKIYDGLKENELNEMMDDITSYLRD